MPITEGLFESTIDLHLLSGFVSRSSPSVNFMLCGLLRKQSALFITRKQNRKEKVRQREEGRARRAKRTWLVVRHGVGQVQTFFLSESLHRFTSPYGSWKCLSLLSLPLPSALIAPAWVCSLLIICPARVSFPTHLCLSSSALHQSNAQWLIWFSSQTYISSIMLPLAVSVGQVPVCQLRTVARQPSRLLMGIDPLIALWYVLNRSFTQVLFKSQTANIPAISHICGLSHLTICVRLLPASPDLRFYFVGNIDKMI